MLFEPYTRTGMLQRLDADFAAVRGSPADSASRWIRNRIGFSWVLALGGWMLLLPASFATAQATRTASPAGSNRSIKNSTAKPPVHHAVHHRHHAKPEAATVAPAPVAPPPLRPAEQPANPATIDFNNGLVTVRAQNSSLVSILRQIQHQSGLVIDGLSHDQRVYGQYGPGSISSTLSALLDGSGYDFVIVGGGSGHAAARLILSTPGSAGGTITPPAVANNQAAPPAEGNLDAAQPEGNPDAPPPDATETGPSPDAEQDGNPPGADQADPSAPPQPKSPQEIFDELRRMHPQ